MEFYIISDGETALRVSPEQKKGLDQLGLGERVITLSACCGALCSEAGCCPFGQKEKNEK